MFENYAVALWPCLVECHLGTHTVFALEGLEHSLGIPAHSLFLAAALFHLPQISEGYPIDIRDDVLDRNIIQGFDAQIWRTGLRGYFQYRRGRLCKSL